MGKAKAYKMGLTLTVLGSSELSTSKVGETFMHKAKPFILLIVTKKAKAYIGRMFHELNKLF
jgi:hypothetical protein